MVKRIFTIIICSTVLTFLCCAVCASAKSTATPIADFFRPAPDIAKNFAPDKIYPQGRIFPFSFFSVESPQLEKVKENYITMLGPYYGDTKVQKSFLEKVRPFGVKFIYGLGEEVSFFDPNQVFPSEEELKKQITEQVTSVAENPEIAWWEIRPEEMRWWRKNEMNYMKIIYEAAKAADPYKRPVWMYEPCNRDADSLLKTLEYQDVCGKGMYPSHAGFKEQRIWCRWSMEQEVEAVRQADKGAIPIAVPEMFVDPEDSDIHLIDDWVRHDVYLAMVTGAKGIVVFSGYGHRKNFTTFDKYYTGYTDIAKKFNGPPALGEVFLFGDKRNDLMIKILSGPATVKLNLKYPDRELTYPSVSFLDIAYGTDRYLFVVNSANDPVTINIDGLPTDTILKKDIFKGGDFTKLSTGSFEITLQPLQVKGFLFAPAQLRN